MSDSAEQPVTMQSMFDDAVRHLLTQNAKAKNEKGCVYIDYATGRRCVMGARIPAGTELGLYTDESLGAIRLQLRAEEAEDTTGEKALQLRAKLAKLQEMLRVPDDLLDFAISLQGIHDHFEADNWASRLHALGDRHGLDLLELRRFTTAVPA